MRGMYFDSAEMRRLLGAFRDYNVRASVLASRALLAMCALLSFSTDHVHAYNHIAIIWLLGTILAGDRRSTFVRRLVRTSVGGHATSTFGPEMGGRDPVLHSSSDAGLPGALVGAPELFA